MKPITPSRWLPPVTGIALLACVFGAHAATGARVVLQAWNPLTPDQETVVTLVDQPTLVSDSLKDAWAEARPKICAQIKGRMGVGGAASGQTLYDITCLLDEQAAFEVTGAGQNTLVGTFAVGGYLEATSTTPTVLGSYADPRFSVAVKAKLALTLAVQPDRDHTLRVTRALFTMSDASLDSHNFTGDVLEFVSEDLIPFFGGPNFKRLAEDAVNAVSIDFASRFNAALAPVNAQLKGPSDAVRVGVSATASYISVAFAPREIVPPANGSMSGVLRWDPAQFAPRNGCQSFDIRATVQTSPVPMFTANAEAATRQVGVFQASSASTTSCGFVITGLAAGWPHVLSARVIDGSAKRSAGSSIYGVSYGLSGDGWDGRKVIPQPVASDRNYLVSRSINATAIEAPGYSSMKQQVEYATSSRINPADIYAARATSRSAEVIAAGVRPGDTVSLNPQPLPPGPDSARTPNVGQEAGARAGIIIVSGKEANPFARKLPAVDRVFGTGVDPALTARAQIQSAQAIDFDALAAKGPVIASQDPLAMELRNQQSEGPARRGFDIGMAAAEGQTAPGPGKQRIQDSLDPVEQGGFAFAVAFSLDRNRNADLAARGAVVAAADTVVAAARRAQPDVLHRLGFDIATGIFGDPALGAQGNTATGPGSMGIRNALNPSAQQGFDDAVALHLGRD